MRVPLPTQEDGHCYPHLWQALPPSLPLEITCIHIFLSRSASGTPTEMPIYR